MNRYLDPEQHRARSQKSIELRFGADHVRDVEIFRVLDRLENRATDVALLLQEHRRGKMPRIGIDGITEQQQLHEWHHHDHRKRDAVSPQLDELLSQHRPGPTPNAAAP